MVTEVRPDARADVRRGDILLSLVHKGQNTEIQSAEQFNKVLAGLDKNAVITLQVRRGDSGLRRYRSTVRQRTLSRQAQVAAAAATRREKRGRSRATSVAASHAPMRYQDTRGVNAEPVPERHRLLGKIAS